MSDLSVSFPVRTISQLTVVILNNLQPSVKPTLPCNTVGQRYALLQGRGTLPATLGIGPNFHIFTRPTL